MSLKWILPMFTLHNTTWTALQQHWLFRVSESDWPASRSEKRQFSWGRVSLSSKLTGYRHLQWGTLGILQRWRCLLWVYILKPCATTEKQLLINLFIHGQLDVDVSSVAAQWLFESVALWQVLEIFLLPVGSYRVGRLSPPRSKNDKNEWNTK